MGAAERYVVVHGHFYQPPRENPWLETVPREPGAAPFHDWNDRITVECYAANANARRLDPAGRVAQIVNNYRRISFNFGPTLIAYLARSAPETYAAILAADRDSAARLAGHGNAIAQAYNHVILPLASDRDKRTQVRWGLEDFAQRFGRPAEGMWLPETAADVASLEALAAEGVRFTVLAPHQAARVRPLADPRDRDRPEANAHAAVDVERNSGIAARDGEADDPLPETNGADAAAAPGGWRDVSDGSIDPRRAYLCRLPSGRSIAIFFYDGPLARAVAFEGVLHSGDAFADRIAAGFEDRDGVQLVHLATDGESYGHHHRFGDMALAAALARLDECDVVPTSYAAFLAEHPPEFLVEVAERTSWSCAHGIERWRSNCGCRTRGDGWSQEWRAGLRSALDALAAAIDRWFEEQAGALVRDPWALRDDLGGVLPDESRRGLRELLDRHAGRALEAREATRLASLLEVQRARLLMFTSCGWFFDELTGIEGTQVLRYAARAIELARGLGFAPPSEFLDHLATARSNRPDVGNGADFFRSAVLPDAVRPLQIALAGAVERLVGVHDGIVRDPPISVEIEPWVERATTAVGGGESVVLRAAVGVAGLVAGHARVRDGRTLEERAFVVAAARHGSFDVIAAGRPVPEGDDGHAGRSALVKALESAFERRAHGTLVAEISRRLGPDFFGLDVLGLASRAAFFPALVTDLEALVAERLAEFIPLATAIEHEAGEVGAMVPPGIAAVIEAARALGGAPEPHADFLGMLSRLEGLVRLLPAPHADPAGREHGSGAASTIRAIVARLLRALGTRAAASRPFPLSTAQEFLWWRIWARSGLGPDALSEIEPLVESLQFAPEAPVAAARDAAFAALLRVVSEEVHAARGVAARASQQDVESRALAQGSEAG